MLLTQESFTFQNPPIIHLDEYYCNEILRSNHLTSWFGAMRPFVTLLDVWDGKGIGLGPLPNDAVMPYSHTRNHVVVGNYVFYHIDIGCTIAGVVFGGIHCAAWGSHFPTPTDQFLWQIASVCTTSLLPMITLCKMMDFDNPEDVKIIHYFLSTLMLLLYLLYIITRLYLVVEVFRTLYFLPSSAFVATWTSEIPHIA